MCCLAQASSLSHPFRAKAHRDAFERIQFSKISVFVWVPFGTSLAANRSGAKTGHIMAQSPTPTQALFSTFFHKPQNRRKCKGLQGHPKDRRPPTRRRPRKRPPINHHKAHKEHKACGTRIAQGGTTCTLCRAMPSLEWGKRFSRMCFIFQLISSVLNKICGNHSGTVMGLG